MHTKSKNYSKASDFSSLNINFAPHQKAQSGDHHAWASNEAVLWDNKQKTDFAPITFSNSFSLTIFSLRQSHHNIVNTLLYLQVFSFSASTWAARKNLLNQKRKVRNHELRMICDCVILALFWIPVHSGMPWLWSTWRKTPQFHGNNQNHIALYLYTKIRNQKLEGCLPSCVCYFLSSCLVLFQPGFSICTACILCKQHFQANNYIFKMKSNNLEKKFI